MATKSAASAPRRAAKTRTLDIYKNDPWLEPYAAAIEGRHQDAVRKEADLTTHCHSLKDFANAHQYFGLHRVGDWWSFREWAPNATKIYLVGDFSDWKELPEFELNPLRNGVWEVHIPYDKIHHGQLYKMSVHWPGGQGLRIPAYATRVVQDPETHIFSAQVWENTPFRWTVENFTPDTRPLLIYECHIGMAQQAEGVGTYAEFRDLILPRIAADGYNAIQIMAIQEHPYYGSFGYHVSSFFAASSRFGTPEDLKSLIDRAHELGIAVIMDIVHSHAVKNENEGLGRLDGSHNLYFYGDHRREHPAWDSLCFDYGKNEVLHFLLSNCKYWLEEYRFDGFRFDGVTSMLYYDHGLGKAFGSYADYYDGNQDTNAIVYLTLANKLIHEINPHAITIAEEMSGMPGLAIKIKDGGIGFDYRMAMGIPDYWIKLLKEKKDEDWHPTSIFWELTNRRADEKTISYVESHDQALVGDKTVIFRLIDKEMYWHMMVGDTNAAVARGMALHKMIRLVTLATINGGYLNFMGNEFGHPEWIDFPREGNGWSYAYARRQWSLADNGLLRYAQLGEFDRAMIALVKKYGILRDGYPYNLQMDTQNQTMAFSHGDLLFVFNWHPSASIPNYEVRVRVPGRYRPILSTDERRFGGTERTDMRGQHFSYPVQGDELPRIRIYNTSRTATVFLREE